MLVLPSLFVLVDDILTTVCVSSQKAAGMKWGAAQKWRAARKSGQSGRAGGVEPGLAL